MHHRDFITKKASNFTELSAKYKLYLISSRRNFWKFPTLIHYRQLNLSPLRYTDVVELRYNILSSSGDKVQLMPLWASIWILVANACMPSFTSHCNYSRWMETSPQKRKKKETDTANHLKQSKSYAYSDPGLSAPSLLLHPNHSRIHHLANLLGLNWGMNQFEVWTGKAKCNTRLWK